MTYFSSLLKTSKTYAPSADRLFSSLDSHGISYGFLDRTRDIWLRDFMPVKTRTGTYVSFRYDPGYLDKEPDLKTDFRRDLSKSLSLENVVYSHINLDGGNVVFSPLKTKAMISDRVFSENDTLSPVALVHELERLLETQILIIPSLKTDMTGHADGMARFIDENTVLGNHTPYRTGLEARIKTALHDHGITVCDFPYFDSNGDSAVGCYLNFLETEQALLFPVFGVDMDRCAVDAAKNFFNKPIVPININEIAEQGGVLNCISWEF